MVQRISMSVAETDLQRMEEEGRTAMLVSSGPLS